MSASMKVQVEAKPLHEPLAGGTQGATVTVEPIVTGTTSFPRPLMESPGGRFLTPRLGWALLTGKEATDPGPGLPDPPPQRRGDPRRHRLHPSIATDAEENFGRMPTRVSSPKSSPTATLRRSSAGGASTPVRSRSSS